MSQFDVSRHHSLANMLLLDIQHDFLDQLRTRMVAPLVLISDFGRPAEHLNPVFEIDNEKYVMDTANLAGLPLSRLGKTVVNLDDHRDEIIAAIDFLTCGF